MSVENRLITVFTPTFNRAYTLHKCYESLKRQTNKNFHWLIIDDGSSDNTKELVNCWIEEKNDFSIEYIYQENQGMHGAHNTAYENIRTELNVCIDSDDYLTDDAIEKIVDLWKQKKNENLAGIVALDRYEDGNIIGDYFPSDLNEVTYSEIYYKYKIRGDKKLVYRTDLMKLNPYPIFYNEKYVSLAYKYSKLEEYKLFILNEAVCVVEYMPDGSSRNMLKQYRNNPRGFMFIRLDNLNNPSFPKSQKYKECIHYVSCCLLIGEKNFMKKNPKKLLTFFAIPLGYMLYKYILRNT